MAQITTDQALLASRNPHDGANRRFVTRVMDHIQNQKRPSLFAKLHHLPRAALVALAIAALALVSGTAYAAYQLWLKPSANVQQFGKNQYGRNQALVAFQSCKDSASATYEVKSSADLTAEQVGQLLQARCEMDAITAWANSSEPPTRSTVRTLYPGAFTVTKIEGDNYSLHGYDDRTVTITKDTAFIVHGVQVSREAIHIGDTVGYVEQDTYAPGGGWPTSRKPIAIVALEMPAGMYETDLQNQVAKREACYGNPSESCVNSGSIDVYPRDGENNMAQTDPGDRYEIQGRIMSHTGTTVTIKASSGALYTVTTPVDMITQFNANASPNYNGLRLETGDMLRVDYAQPANANHKVMQPRQVQSVVLMIELVKKTDPIKKY